MREKRGIAKGLEIGHDRRERERDREREACGQIERQRQEKKEIIERTN